MVTIDSLDSKIVSMVQNMAAPITFKQEIHSAHLERDLGFDSLDLVELLLNIEKEFDLEIDESRLSDVHTVQDLVNLLTPMVVPTVHQ